MKYLIAILLPIFLFSRGGKKETIHPVKKDLTQAVYASGKIFPKDDYKVSARLSGYVEQILVKVGDTVKAGQPLIVIKSEISNINVEAAKNQMELATRNASENGPILNALKQDVSAARSKYELDSLNYRRYENLLSQNSISQLQLDQAKVQFESSRAAYTRSLYNYNSTRDRLRTEAENAKLQLDAQTSNRGDYTIMAAVNGKIYDIVPRIGDLVNSQMPVIEIGSASEFEIELSIDEQDIALVQTAQKVLYEIDAYEGQPFYGTITEIYPRISNGNKTAKIISTAEFASNMTVFSGMSVEANIVISEKKSVLVIPREFISPGNKVFVKGKEEAVVIKTGASDLEYAEVISGITESDELELR